MRVPVSSPISCNNNNNNNNNNSGRSINFRNSYEPTSVLDLRRSPSPVKEKTEIWPLPNEAVIELDDHVLHNWDLDSIMKDLGLHDDSVYQPLDHTQFVPSDFNFSDVYANQNFNSSDWNSGLEFIEELIRAADCFDSNDLNLAQMILARLNQRLQSATGKPLHRAAFYFKEALQQLLSGNRMVRLSSWSEIVQTIKAYKAFSSISPIPLFSHFTVNQALLEALRGSPFVHIIDFDIGLGGQYASFLKEIAERSDAGKSTPVIRITAVVPEEYAIETRLIKENLSQFAQELKIGFHIEFVLIRTFEMLSFKSIKFIDGEKTAVNLSPAIFRRLTGGENSIARFLTDIRKISPCVVVFVENDGWTDNGTTSFGRNFLSCLDFYTTMFESLDAAVAGGDWIRKIEMILLRPKIIAAVESGGRRGLPWREVFHGAGMRPVQLSQFAGFQAECLLGKVQVRGFHVGRRQAELVLCWHERALVATSAWRF